MTPEDYLKVTPEEYKTLSQGQKLKVTLYKKYGVDYYQKIGAKGGKVATGYQFAHGKLDPREIAIKSWQSPKRKKR